MVTTNLRQPDQWQERDDGLAFDPRDDALRVMGAFAIILLVGTHWNWVAAGLTALALFLIYLICVGWQQHRE